MCRQACGSPKAASGMNYHDDQGNPIVNTDRFPDFNKMTDHAHSLNLTSGWYGELPRRRPCVVVTCHFRDRL